MIFIGCTVDWIVPKMNETTTDEFQFLYYVSYILILKLRQMLNFDCKDENCYIFIKHHDQLMPEKGIDFKQTLEYLEDTQAHAPQNETITEEVSKYKIQMYTLLIIMYWKISGPPPNIL